MTLLNEILLVIIFIIGILYYWIRHQYSYWERKNIPFIPPTPIFGNLKDMFLMKRNSAESMIDFYNHKNAENEPIVGIYVFHKPGLLIREPELIKNVLIKDFVKFSNRYGRIDPHVDALGAYNLFFLRNQEWKVMRSKLSPTFTSGRMKQMFPLVNDIGKQLDAYLRGLSLDPETESVCVDVKETSALYTTDVIGSVAFGIQANSLKNPNGEFRTQGKKLFKFTFRKAIDFSVAFFIPQLVSVLKSKVFPADSEHFIRSTIAYIMNEREKSGTTRNDLIDTLIALKNASENDTEKTTMIFDDDKIVAQAAVFFTAGFESSSSTMAFALYELSRNIEMQNRVRNEIKDILEKNNGDITYETIQNMEYLNMVVHEVLRMYPPLPFLDRQCILAKDEKDYSLEPFSDFKIPDGMPVYIPVYPIHKDPKYYPDPHTFNPERFSPENKSNIHSSIYMPFGSGPHNCIGERFGLMQVKIGLVNFFKNHYVRPSPKTPKVEFERKALIIQAKDGVYLEVFRNSLLK